MSEELLAGVLKREDGLPDAAVDGMFERMDRELSELATDGPED